MLEMVQAEIPLMSCHPNTRWSLSCDLLSLIFRISKQVLSHLKKCIGSSIEMSLFIFSDWHTAKALQTHLLFDYVSCHLKYERLRVRTPGANQPWSGLCYFMCVYSKLHFHVILWFIRTLIKMCAGRQNYNTSSVKIHISYYILIILFS